MKYPKFISLKDLSIMQLRHLVIEGVFSPYSENTPIINRKDRVCLKVVTTSAVEIFQSALPITWEKDKRKTTIHFLDMRKPVTMLGVKSITYTN